MRFGMDVPKLWSVLAVIAMGMLITCSTSCKSGKKLNSNSSGVIRVITPNDLIAQPNGTYKLKPAAPIVSKPIIERKAVRSSPVPKNSASAKPTPSKPVVQASNPLVHPMAKEAPATVVPKNSVEETPIKISMNVKRPQASNSNKGEVVTEEPQAPVKIDWFGLVFFYLSALLLAVGGWAIYDMYKSKKKSS